MIKQIKQMICILIGHSRIQEGCWGYFSCGRCGQQLGDTLGGSYDTSDLVIVNHSCKVCEQNYKYCTWKDKLLVQNPFKEEKKK